MLPRTTRVSRGGIFRQQAFTNQVLKGALDKWFTICEHRTVRVISRKALLDFAAKHRDAAEPLDNWYRRAKKADWSNLSEVRADYPHADLVGTCTVFNIKGNVYRLVTKIFYGQRKVLIRFALTHKEYDRGRWKNDCGG